MPRDAHPDFDELAERISPDQLAEALGAERTSSGWRCPLPDRHTNGDREPSFSVFRDDSRTAARCHGCGLRGSPVTVAADVWGIGQPEAARRLTRHIGMAVSSGNGRREIAGTYNYTDEDGRLLFQVVRFRPKAFRQRAPDGENGWNWSTQGVRRVLYRLPEVLEAVEASERIFVVEGEKDADALSDLGVCATCNPGGAGKWRPSYTRTLAGALVGIIADADDAGRNHAWTVARELEGVAEKVVVLEPAYGDDVSDHLAAGLPLSDLKVVEEPPQKSSANTANVEWREPIPLGPDTPEPYPVDALPDWLAQYVLSVATATQTPTDLPLMVGLAALSVATANKVRVVVKAGYDVPAHLWTATVLPPASRKSPVFRHMTRPIFEYEEELASRTAPERQRAADERDVVERALADAKKEAARAAGSETEGEARQKMRELRDRLEGIEVPGEPRLVASDVTSEKLARLMADNHGRVAVLAPEGDLFRIMAGRYSGGVSFDHYKRAWTGDEPIRDDRVGRDGSHVRRPALTMGLCLQPSVLDTLEEKDSFRGEGLLGRFLYAVPDSGIGRRRTGSSVPELNMDAARRYRDNLRRMLDAPPREVADDGEYVPHEMTLSPDARALWDSFAGEVEAMLGPGGRMEHVPDWGGKLVGQVFRLAAILQAAHRVGEGADPWGSELSGRAMRSAVQIGRAAIPHALQVFDALEADPDLRLARYLLRRLRGLTANQDDPPTQRDLFEKVKGKKGLGTVEELERVLEILEAHHLVRVVPRPSTGGRPPSPVVQLNPDATPNIRKSRKSPPKQEKPPTSANTANLERGNDPQSEDAFETGIPEASEPESVEVEL